MHPTITTPPPPTALTQRQRRLNRRQRKKAHVGEFHEWGLSITAHLQGFASEAAHDAFIDDFLGLIESHTLLFGGGFGSAQAPRLDGTVAYAGRASVEQRHAYILLEWLARNPHVSAVENCQWVNLWHGPFE